MAAGPAPPAPVAANQQLHQPVRLEYTALAAAAHRLLNTTFHLEHLFTTPTNSVVMYTLFGSFAQYESAVNSARIAPKHKRELLTRFDTHLSEFLIGKSQYIDRVFTREPRFSIQTVREHPQTAHFGVFAICGMAHFGEYDIRGTVLDSHTH